MKWKHYDTTTLSHPLSGSKTLSYIHTIKLFTIFPNYFYLSYLLPTTYPTYHILPRLHIAYLLSSLPNKLIV